MDLKKKTTQNTSAAVWFFFSVLHIKKNTEQLERKKTTLGTENVAKDLEII